MADQNEQDRQAQREQARKDAERGGRFRDLGDLGSGDARPDEGEPLGRVPAGRRVVNENTGSTEASRSGLPETPDPEAVDDTTDAEAGNDRSEPELQRSDAEGGDIGRDT
jgi:hypothetical protein